MLVLSGLRPHQVLLSLFLLPLPSILCLALAGGRVNCKLLLHIRRLGPVFLDGFPVGHVVSDCRCLIKLIGLLALVINGVDRSLVIVSLVMGAEAIPVVERADLGKVLQH